MSLDIPNSGRVFANLGNLRCGGAIGDAWMVACAEGGGMDTINLGARRIADVQADHVAEYAERVARGAVESMLFGHRVPVAQAVGWRLDDALRAIAVRYPRADYVAVWWHDPAVPAYRYVLRGGDTALLTRLVEPWGGFTLRDGHTAVFAAPGLLHAPVGRVERGER